MKIMITGASRGLGKELVNVFSNRGNYLIMSNRNGSYELSEEGVVVSGDLTYLATINTLYHEAELVDGVDVLINCAGIYANGEFDQVEFKKVMDVNFFAPVLLTMKLFPLFRRQKGGCIVNLNSLAGKVAGKGEMVYAASKHALKGFFDSLKFEATKYNIKILNVYSGAMKTDMTKHRPDWDKLIDPKEVARVIFDLCQNYKSLNINEITITRSNY